MSNHRAYVIFSASGERHSVEAANLRKAIKQSGVPEAEIVAAVEQACLPVESQEPRPLIAVLLKNTAYVPPKYPGEE